MKKEKRFGTGRLIYEMGREGPRQDPYSYEEWTIDRDNGRKTTLHLGLAEWIEIDGKRADARPARDPGRLDTAEIVDKFEEQAGVSLRTCQRAIDHVARCCDNMRPVSATGYPGEHFTICRNCNKHLDSYFNLSEVI